MAFPLKPKTLAEQITNASNELKLARRDGSADWINKAARKLDELLDQLSVTKNKTDA